MSEHEAVAKAAKKIEKNPLSEVTRSKPDEKKIEKIVTNQVIQRKKPMWNKFRDFFTGDRAKNIGDYVLWDILIPSGKAMVHDSLTGAVDRAIYQDDYHRARSRRDLGGRSRTDYNRASRSNRRPGSRDGFREDPRELSRRGRSTHNFDEIILATRQEADEVLDRMYDLLDRFEEVTVADLLGMVDISSKYTDDKWGWTDLQGSGVTRLRDGYLLDLPKPEPLGT